MCQSVLAARGCRCVRCLFTLCPHVVRVRGIRAPQSTVRNFSLVPTYPYRTINMYTTPPWADFPLSMSTLLLE